MNNLIKSIGTAAVVLGMAAAAQGTLYDGGWTVNAAIPDGNIAGWSDTRTVSGLGNQITDVNVQMTISGGYNGDLYGYLVSDSGFAVLLNRVGSGAAGGADPGTTQYTFGFDTKGFGTFTLDDGVLGTANIHSADAVNPAGGTWKSDGLTLNSFNGGNPNGTWTLFLADMSLGETSTLVSWGLDIEAVPEPVTWALIGFGLIFGGVTGVRVIRARRRACPQ
jgi:subtilisin-like proprotein convertase family protein